MRSTRLRDAEIGLQLRHEFDVGRDADQLSRQLFGRLDVRTLRHQEGLPVIEHDRTEAHIGARFTAEGPGQSAQHDVDIVRLQKARQNIDRAKRRLGRIAENGGRDRTAEIDVEAVPVLAGIVPGEAGDIVAEAAGHHAFRLDRIETRAQPRQRSRTERKAEGESECQYRAHQAVARVGVRMIKRTDHGSRFGWRREDRPPALPESRAVERQRVLSAGRSIAQTRAVSGTKCRNHPRRRRRALGAR